MAATAPKKRSLAQIPGSLATSETHKLIADPFGRLLQLLEQHGPVFKTNLGSPVVFLVGPEANREILSRSRSIFGIKEGFEDTPLAELFRGSLLTMSDDDAMKERHLLQPALTRAAAALHAATLHKDWSDALARLDDGCPHDIHTVCAPLGFDAAMRFQLGLERSDALFEEIHPLIQGLMGGAEPGITDEEFQRALDARRKLLRRLVDLVERSRKAEAHGLVGILARQCDEHGRALDAEQIAENLVLLFWAGYDTFVATASWMFWNLAALSDWQQALFEDQRILEVDRRGEPDRLKRHEWVIRETERLNPIGLFFPRRLLEDYTFRGHLIPQGTLVAYSAFLTHRLAELFPDPHVFAPERWDPALDRGAHHASSLVGFGAGPRVCLGKAFAQFELRVLLQTVVGRFEFARAPGAKMSPKMLPVCRPVGAELVFKRRAAQA